MAAAPFLLTAAGFTAGGVAAGSIAAAVQSAFYGGSVGAGSAFAVLQSAGAAGIGLAGNAAIAGTGATVVGGLTSAIGAKLSVCVNPTLCTLKCSIFRCLFTVAINVASCQRIQFTIKNR